MGSRSQRSPHAVQRPIGNRRSPNTETETWSPPHAGQDVASGTATMSVSVVKRTSASMWCVNRSGLRTCGQDRTAPHTTCSSDSNRSPHEGEISSRPRSMSEIEFGLHVGRSGRSVLESRPRRSRSARHRRHRDRADDPRRGIRRDPRCLPPKRRRIRPAGTNALPGDETERARSVASHLGPPRNRRRVAVGAINGISAAAARRGPGTGAVPLGARDAVHARTVDDRRPVPPIRRLSGRHLRPARASCLASRGSDPDPPAPRHARGTTAPRGSLRLSQACLGSIRRQPAFGVIPRA